MESRHTVQNGDDHTWVVVVATDGKDESPLQQTLRHAWELAPRERICAVVPAEHREWWRRPLWVLPASNVIAQPGTATGAEGVSQSMEKILERDSAAKVVLLPATRDAQKDGAIVGPARAVLDAVKRHWPLDETGALTAFTRCAPGPWAGDAASVPA